MNRGERSVWVSRGGTDEEIAAVMAGLVALLEQELADEIPSRPHSRWVRQGRLEAHGMRITERALRRGWSAV